jgi:hypothetical protein
MPEPKLTKRADGPEETTKMPKALRTLVAAVGASALGLLGLPSAFVNASNPPAAISETRPQSSNATTAKLLLNQVGGQVQLAGAGGHESHASHASHESHASHASGGYR